MKMRPFYFSTCNNGAGIGAGIGAGTIHSHESTLCFPRLASNGRLFDTNTHAPHFPLALKLLVCLEDLVYFDKKLYATLIERCMSIGLWSISCSIAVSFCVNAARICAISSSF